MSASGLAVFKIEVSERVAVTAKVEMPSRIGAKTPALILAHGANNDLDHPLLVAVAQHLAADTGTIVARFNFPYVERGSSRLLKSDASPPGCDGHVREKDAGSVNSSAMRATEDTLSRRPVRSGGRGFAFQQPHDSPDSARVIENTFRRVHDHIADEFAAPGAPIFIGGKSLGGRIAAELLSRGEEGEGLAAAGLVELGYPLHRPGHREALITEPLRKIGVPSLFVIGEKDPLCDPDLLRPLLQRFLHPGKLVVVPGGDHSLRVGTTKDGPDEFAEVAAEVARFVISVVEQRVGRRQEPEMS